MTVSRRDFLLAAGLALGRPRSGSATARWRLHALADAVGLQPGPLERFRASLAGSLVLPGDALFDSVRRVWSFNPATDKRPSVIARCANADDTGKAIRFARDQSLEIAVRSGGHDILGASVCEGGLVIDLSPMKAIEIKVNAKTAQTQTGVLSGELSRAAAAYDLAPVLGCNPSVGIGGLTLGGGLGFFLGTRGATCDNLLAADIVGADGSLRRASAREHPDLYWAIRGGGGNFGVATNFTFRLHGTPSVLAGVVAFRVKELTSFLRFYRDFMAAAPDLLVAELSIFPERGAIGIWVLTCWNGDGDAGARALSPLRTFTTPTADTIELVPPRLFLRRMPTREPAGSQPRDGGSNSTVPVQTDGYWRGGTLAALSDDVINRMTLAIDRAPDGWQLGLGHYLHGEVCRRAVGETPFIRRPGASTYFFSATWPPTARSEAHVGWVDSAWQSIEAATRTPSYVNYLSVATEDAVRAAYGANYSRLSDTKRTYDAENVFHLNRNIRPSVR